MGGTVYSEFRSGGTERHPERAGWTSIVGAKRSPEGRIKKNAGKLRGAPPSWVGQLGLKEGGL